MEEAGNHGYGINAKQYDPLNDDAAIPVIKESLSNLV